MLEKQTEKGGGHIQEEFDIKCSPTVAPRGEELRWLRDT